MADVRDLYRVASAETLTQLRVAFSRDRAAGADAEFCTQRIMWIEAELRARGFDIEGHPTRKDSE